jgi:hypothetical protein
MPNGPLKLIARKPTLLNLKKILQGGLVLDVQASTGIPQVKSYEKMNIDGLTVEKLTYKSEEDIIIPALLIKPEKIKQGSPVYFYVSEDGKPTGYQNENIPFLLAKEGYVVFAADVRGTGETSPTPSFSSNQYTGYTPLLRIHDDLAIQSAEFGKQPSACGPFDIMKGLMSLNHERI